MSASTIMKKLSIAAAGAALLASGIVFKAKASTMTLESAPLDFIDTDRLAGSDVDAEQFLGWRFKLESTLQVTDIGGTFFGFSGGQIFGAIVPLTGSEPVGSPFSPSQLSGEVLASAIFTPPNGNNDITTPLSVRLSPGSYGLIFGSGLFGASGDAAMTSAKDTVPIPTDSQFFFGNTEDDWSENLSFNRFVIKGESVPVPEPTFTLSILALGTLSAGLTLKRSKKG